MNIQSMIMDASKQASFVSNLQYLEFRKDELNKRIQITTLNSQKDIFDDENCHHNSKDLLLDRNDDEHEQDVDLTALKDKMDARTSWLEKQLKENMALRKQMTKASEDINIPIENISAKYCLDEIEEDLLLILLFTQIDPDFAKKMKILSQSLMYDYHCITVKLVFSMYASSFKELLYLKTKLSISGALVKNNLVVIDAGNQENFLDAEILLNQRLINFLLEDNNIYSMENAFFISYPNVPIHNVIINETEKTRIVSLVKNHFQMKSHKLHDLVNQNIPYGQGLVFLFYGPSGTGKTLLAQSLSYEVNKPLITLTNRKKQRRHSYVDENDIVEVFQQAYLLDGIMFFDECETIFADDSDELSALLVEIEKCKNIVILATNKPEKLGSSLDRRITYKFQFPFPSVKQREAIWSVLLSDMPLASDVDLYELASSYPYTGGYIKNAVLVAFNMLLTENGHDTSLEMTMGILQKAAQMQECHIGNISLWRKIIQPDVPDNDLLGDTNHQLVDSEVRRISAYLNLVNANSFTNVLCSVKIKGYKSLLHGPYLSSGKQMAYSISKKLHIPIDEINLEDILYKPRIQRYYAKSDHSEKKGDIELFDIFNYSLEHENILLIIDEKGYWNRLHSDSPLFRNEEEFVYFINAFKQFEGILFVVTTCRNLLNHPQFKIFHSKHPLLLPDKDYLLRFLKGKLSDLKISLKDSAGVRQLLEEYTLTTEDIEQILYNLLLSGELSKSCAKTDDLIVEQIQRYCQNGFRLKPIFK